MIVAEVCMKKLAVWLLRVTFLCLPAFVLADETTVFSGRVEALNRVDISAQIEGVVTAIYFQPGQTVTEGDLLLSIDRTEFAQRLRAAEAVARKAEAVLEDAQQEYDRNQALKERGTISDSRYFKSKVAVSIAAAAVAETKSRLEAAEIDLRRTDIRAPISGIISPPLVSRGSFVETGRKGVLAGIVQLDPVRIAYEIPYPDRLIELGITDLSTIGPYADSVDLSVELAPGWEHPELAEPTHLSADVSPETRSITAWAIVANPSHTLRPGMDVKVSPFRATSDGLEKPDVD
jgi:RND family efflux transporter MFP subunit